MAPALKPAVRASLSVYTRAPLVGDHYQCQQAQFGPNHRANRPTNRPTMRHAVPSCNPIGSQVHKITKNRADTDLVDLGIFEDLDPVGFY